jgi:hypothetical protein
MNQKSIKDLFIFNFPKDFVSNDIENRYKIFLDNYHKSHATVLDYVNSLIKGIDLPSLKFSTSSQKKLYGVESNFRGASVPYNIYERTFKITMSLPDFYISYRIIEDVMLNIYTRPTLFIEPFEILSLDNNRKAIFKTTISEIIPEGMGGIELSYSDNSTEEKTIDLNFKFNYIDTECLLDYESYSDAKLIEEYTT